MTVLHTISKAPSSQLLAQCCKALHKGDALLLLEDGVYYGVQSAAELSAAIPDKVAQFCLREDVTARGLQERLAGHIESISMRQFVELCCKHDKVINWF